MFKNKPTASEIIRGVKEVIPTPEVWTQGTGGRDANDESVDPFSKSCTKRCLLAAVTFSTMKLTGLLDESETINRRLTTPEMDALTKIRYPAELAITKAIRKHHPKRRGMLGFNDHKNTTHADVNTVVETAQIIADENSTD